MFSNALLILFSYSFISRSASADGVQCTSRPLHNTTDELQASSIVRLLNNAQNLLEIAKNYATINVSCPATDSRCGKPMDCADIYEVNPFISSGIYKIWPRSRVSSGPISVYCDMEDDGGGWTVIQKRGNFDSPKDYFYQDWAAYKKGFGYLIEDFWLGNDNIFAVTNQKINRLKFSLSDWEGNETYAMYDEFWIADELHKYRAHVKGYRGTAGDSFSFTNGVPFSTKDQDNDLNDKGNCATRYKGAWWYTSCHTSNLNGQYLQGPHESFADGVIWYHWRGHHYSLKDTTIKIRPKDFKGCLTVITTV